MRKQRKQVPAARAFKILDVYGRGHINKESARCGLEMLGCDDADSDRVNEILSRGSIYDESAFAKVALKEQSTRNPIEEILKMFVAFDEENKGYINTADLMRVAATLNIPTSPKIIATMIEKFGSKPDRVTKEEFVNLLTNGF
eukprot:TRINITY_DN16196_c0_g1_i1.p1 TRINITY_DN16196_c0_g1~~TRINITY_DN16196_c0_g1_i1.p1  ORF type:complete len:143 (-),score=23.06 TRINITY_DN16196_c0_g1_i1:632-1060(-)